LADSREEAKDSQINNLFYFVILRLAMWNYLAGAPRREFGILASIPIWHFNKALSTLPL
jgi:hypothetical protein